MGFQCQALKGGLVLVQVEFKTVDKVSQELELMLLR